MPSLTLLQPLMADYTTSFACNRGIRGVEQFSGLQYLRVFISTLATVDGSARAANLTMPLTVKPAGPIVGAHSVDLLIRRLRIIYKLFYCRPCTAALSSTQNPGTYIHCVPTCQVAIDGFF